MKHIDLTIVGDGVTTLMYASAVNVIMTRSVNIVDSNIFIAIGLILFIFVDWLSRIWVPRSFRPEEDQTKRREFFILLLKTLFEITGIYFLVTASIHILCPSSPSNGDNNIINNRIAFAGYLFMTFCWNLIILYTMKKLSWKQLMVGAINGSVFYSEAADVYTGRFKNSIIAVEKEIQKQGTTKDMMKNFKKFRKLFLLRGGGRTIGQLLACHIAFVNIIVGIALLLGRGFFFQYQLYEEWFGNIWCTRIVIFFVLIVPIILFYLYEKNLKENNDEETGIALFLRVIAGILVITLLILFYTAFDANDIIFVMIIQQAIFSIIILSSVPKATNNKNTITVKLTH